MEVAAALHGVCLRALAAALAAVLVAMLTANGKNRHGHQLHKVFDGNYLGIPRAMLRNKKGNSQNNSYNINQDATIVMRVHVGIWLHVLYFTLQSPCVVNALQHRRLSRTLPVRQKPQWPESPPRRV